MTFVLKRGATAAEMAELDKKLRETKPAKTLDAKKFCGVLKLKYDPLNIQKQLRDEWE